MSAMENDCPAAEVDLTREKDPLMRTSGFPPSSFPDCQNKAMTAGPWKQCYASQHVASMLECGGVAAGFQLSETKLLPVDQQVLIFHKLLLTCLSLPHFRERLHMLTIWFLSPEMWRKDGFKLKVVCVCSLILKSSFNFKNNVFSFQQRIHFHLWKVKMCRCQQAAAAGNQRLPAHSHCFSALLKISGFFLLLFFCLLSSKKTNCTARNNCLYLL